MKTNAETVWAIVNKLLSNQKRFTFIITDDNEESVTVKVKAAEMQDITIVLYADNQEEIWQIICDELPLSRNAKYELKLNARGLRKKTVWIPKEAESEFDKLAKVLTERPHLTFAMLRDKVSGLYVAIKSL